MLRLENAAMQFSQVQYEKIAHCLAGAARQCQFVKLAGTQRHTLCGRERLQVARFAGTVKVTAISRLPPVRRLAMLVAFIDCLRPPRTTT